MKLKLVIVDDAPFIREVLKHIVSNTEIEVIGEAVNGEEAVLLVNKLKPDVVLMDIVMPKKSGIDATIEILKTNPDIKIIASSTVDQNTMVLRALDAGCVNYLTKPFQAQDVLKVIRRAFDSKGREPNL